jgi:hypothetical protein
MDAHEYLLLERVVLDHRDDIERFSLEHAFHFEAADDTDGIVDVPAGGSCARSRPTPG